MNFIIFGEIGAGKDTVAEILRELTGGKIVKLGKKIHEQVDEYYPLLPEGTNKRKLFQDYGERMRDVFGQDIWNYVLHNEIRYGLAIGQSYIIADARQVKEYVYWKDRGFIPVGLKADAETRMNRVIGRDGFDQKANFNHYTEINARKIINEIQEKTPQFIIQNDGSLNTLRKRIEELVVQTRLTS